MDKIQIKIINRFGQAKNTKKHLIEKLRNKSLRNLVFLMKRMEMDLPFSAKELDKHIPELDKWIMTKLECKERCAWEYRQAILAIRFGWN
jgi:hypothetical protein